MEVWRIALVPNQIPNVYLIPPVIGEDSALFDRLTLRLRLIHHSPIEGFFWMYWSNVKYNRRTDNVNRARFREERRQRYPIEWEDITVDLRALAEAGPAVRDYPATWQDTLFKLDINLKLYEDYLTRRPQYVDDDLPTFLEIDSIQLTGAEELAQGELSPRDIAVGVGAARHVVRRARLFLPRRAHQAVARRCGGRHRRRWRCRSRNGLGPPQRGPKNTTGLERGVQRRIRRL